MLRNFARKTLTTSQKRYAKHVVYRLLYGRNLPGLANAFGTDKEGSHYYAQHYQKHFAHLRDKKINLLEIGVGGADNPGAGGESLRMWKAFFPKANIYGLDIYDKSFHDEPRIKTFKGDQVDKEFLHSVVDEIGRIDIVVDDGSHYNEHVIETFKILFPLIDENGIYAIEDLQTSYWTDVLGDNWGGSTDLNAPHTSMNFLKSLLDCLNYEEFTDENYEPSYFDRNIISLHFYHNLAFVCKGLNNEGSNVLGKRFN